MVQTLKHPQPDTTPDAYHPISIVPLAASRNGDGGKALEASTQTHGRALLAALRRHGRGSSSDWLYAQLMQLTTADEATRVQLFRFVDVLSSLKSPHSVAQSANEFLGQPNLKLPPMTPHLLRLLSRTPLTERLLSSATFFGTGLIARRFIAGRNAQEAAGAVLRLRKRNLAFTLDLLGEAVTSEAEALAYQQKYLDLIGEMPDIVNGLPLNEQVDAAPWGKLPRANISIKLSALYARFDPMAAEATAVAVKARLRPILTLARAKGVFVNFDMEQYSFRNITRRIFEEILCEPEFLDWPDVGIVVQTYLQDSQDDLEKLLAWTKKRGTPVWVRLVKGAYWDYEIIVAAQRGHPVPVFSQKAHTDANHERLTEFLLSHWEHLRPAIATHNVRSAARAQAIAQKLKLPPRAVEYQVLYGMGEPIGRALASQGERVRVYVPFGELLPGMAYLVRRLLENTSNDSFIRRVEQGDQPDTTLLAPPSLTAPAATKPTSPLLPAFRNEPETDLDMPRHQEQMRTALAEVERQLGATVPIIINNRAETSPQVWERPDPSDTGRIVSRSHHATPEQAKRAVEAAQLAFPAWRDTPVAERTALLRRVAAEFRRRRFEIAAWQVYEVGKPWREAEGDIAEAIDFCEFYAAEMERLDAHHRRDVPGEWNDYFYEARGPAVIIAPWNFPLAILTGMSVAALVAGNPVIIKPSEQSTRVGAFLIEALMAAGVPPGVANFLPGEGETVGPVLVNHPHVALIAFTGSREVGLSILRDAAVLQPGQREIKRVILELGGKNAMIVDEDADLDEAVLGVLASFTGFAGQKCSACSRAIVVGSAYEPFCARLSEAVKSLCIGPAEDPATTLGPVVDETAQQRIQEYIGIGNREGRLLAQIAPDEALAGRGFYVPASIFTGCPPEGRLCQEEVFGPVLAVLPAPDLDAALEIADDTVYGLTGGFYGRSPAHIERARREFRVGNLYINRKITGALVDRQPFGGARLSGVGSKAGGPDYLVQFLVPRTITESVMRRGFAPSQDARESSGGI